MWRFVSKIYISREATNYYQLIPSIITQQVFHFRSNLCSLSPAIAFPSFSTPFHHRFITRNSPNFPSFATIFHSPRIFPRLCPTSWSLFLLLTLEKDTTPLHSATIPCSPPFNFLPISAFLPSFSVSRVLFLPAIQRPWKMSIAVSEYICVCRHLCAPSLVEWPFI